MAEGEVKISALPSGSSLTGVEKIPMVQGGITIEASAQEIADLSIPLINSKQDKSNGVLTGCTITLGSYGGSGTNNDIRVTEGTWRISPREYGNVGTGNTDFLDIVLSASGLQRYIELVGTTSNTIIKIEGAESAIAVRPTLGAGQVSLGSILVKDALIDPPVPDLSGYVTRNGNETISRNEIFTTTSDIAFGINGIISNILYISTSQTQLRITNGSKFAGLFLNTDGSDANTRATLSVDTKSFEIHKLTGGTMYGDIIKYNSDRTTEINANGLALINRAYADSKYALSGSSGATNLGYTPSPTDGVVTSDTGTDATLTLVDGTNAGLVSPSMKSTWDNKQNTLSVPSDAEMQTGTDNVKYTTALRITTWWTWVKTQAQTFLAQINFSGLAVFGNSIEFTNTQAVGTGDGFYRPSTNVLGVKINGVEVARWDSTNYTLTVGLSISGNIFDLTINPTVATGNANVNINPNLVNALNFKDTSANDYLRFISTTGNLKLQALQQLEITKSLKQSAISIVSDITLDLNYRIIYVDATSNDVTITLPNPTVAIYQQIEYAIKRIDSSAFVVTIQTNVGTVFIDGGVLTSLALTSLQSKVIRNRNATQWQSW